MSAGPHERCAHEADLEGAAGFVERPSLSGSALAELRRQRGGWNHAALRRPYRKRGQHVLQLTHVAWPVIACQRGKRGCAERRAAADALGGIAPEVFGEQRDIFAAIPQRRHGDVHDVEAIEQVEPEPAGVHFGAQCAIGRRHDPDVDSPCHVFTDAAQLAILDDAQMRELRDRGFRRLILDLRGLLFIDSSGLHLILRYDAEARRDGFALELLPGNRTVQLVFEVSGVAAQLPFADA